MRSLLLSSLLVALLATPAHAAGPATVHLRSGPARVLIEQLPERQDLNFELFVDNPGAVALTIGKLQVSAYDARGRNRRHARCPAATPCRPRRPALAAARPADQLRRP